MVNITPCETFHVHQVWSDPPWNSQLPIKHFGKATWKPTG